jgi:hypothetical protein
MATKRRDRAMELGSTDGFIIVIAFIILGEDVWFCWESTYGKKGFSSRHIFSLPILLFPLSFSSRHIFLFASRRSIFLFPPYLSLPAVSFSTYSYVSVVTTTTVPKYGTTTTKVQSTETETAYRTYDHNS